VQKSALRPWLAAMTSFSVGRALAEIAILEAGKAAAAMASPTAAHSYSVARLQEERARQAAAKEAAWIAKLEAKYQERRRSRKTALEKAATSGRGWIVLDRDHSELNRLGRSIHDLGLMATPWPTGWTFKWADLRGRTALGMCEWDAKLILVDLDAHRGGFASDSRQLVETLVHEIAHMYHPGGAHGPAFAETLRRLKDFVMPDDEPVEVAARPSLTPRKGVVFSSGKAAPWPGAGDWEFR
jgi:hypothetical protein